MKKKISVLFLFVLVSLLTLALCACGSDGEKKNEGDDVKETQEEKVEPKISLDTLTLDDARYSIGEFKKDVFEYTVGLPDGRPTIPRVQATAADGIEIKISQAYIPDSETIGVATVAISDAEGNSATYKVTFERSIANGFVLQYDDRYYFNAGYHNDTGDPYVYTSSDPDIISVDENGIMTAKKVAEKEVTLYAHQGEMLKATFVVDRVEKADINLFFITGQSNGQGCYDSTNYGKDVEHLVPFEEQISLVEKIGGEGRVYSFDVYPRSQNTEVYKMKGAMYDMELYAKQGHQASLGKTFYDLSGEKVVFLQSAYSGSPIESWLDPKRHKDEAGPYGSHYFYTDTQKAYKQLKDKLKDNYDIVYVANFWCQGETAMSAVYDKRSGDYIFSSNAAFDKSKLITDETYYNYFMMLHNDMVEDFGLQYNGIMFVKTKGQGNETTKIVPIISAQFALCNNNDDIHVASRHFIEIARQYKDSDKTSEGYGFMGTDNNHYNQIGYNYLGKECAVNAFNAKFGEAVNVPEAVEIIAQNGTKRMTSTDSVTIRAGGTLRVGALSVPHYINEKIVWTSNKEDVATVNEFGVIKGVSGGTAIITATNESGKSESIYVTVN
ncbi:MAG: hypothetical protein E7615_03095 [Ruminococcaceae bacterium]|nr:hypothetical protein [Oscillospiraceae bacterium]